MLLSIRSEPTTMTISTFVSDLFPFRRACIFGIAFQANGCVYEGEFQRGERHGQGICTFPGGERYAGCWEDGKMHGQGTLDINGRTLAGRAQVAVWAFSASDFGN